MTISVRIPNIRFTLQIEVCLISPVRGQSQYVLLYEDVYLLDSVSRGLSMRESALKSKGSASCSSSIQSLSGRFPEREYFASAQ